MDFADKTFPYQLYNHDKIWNKRNFLAPCCSYDTKRKLFASCGSHDNIDVDNVTEKKFYPQKIPEGFVNKRTSLKARRPALPLHEDPEQVTYPLVDRVTDPITEEKKELTSLLYNLKFNRGILKTKPGNKTTRYLSYGCFNELKNKLDDLGIEEDVPDSEAMTFLHPKFHYLISLYQKYKSCTEIKKVNSRYADGCLGYLPLKSAKSAGCLIKPVEDFRKLKISCLTYDDKEDVKVDTTCSINTDDEIYGVTACYSRDKGYILTRHASSCQMYSLGEDCNPEIVQKLKVKGAPLTSQCMSPYIPGESLIATDNGSVYLWSLGNRKKKVIRQKEQRFYCRDQWRQAIFSSHPRQIILADCTAVELFDLRTEQTNGTDLFALPSKLLHPNERIRIIKQLTPFMYVIGTDYSLIVTDERFPGHPLLQWQHMLRYPPQYLSVLSDVGTQSQSLISIASQNPMEAYCHMLQGGIHKTVQGLGSPWKLARPDDITKWDEMCNSTDGIAVEHRYNRDSLLGLQCVNLRNGFVAYQLDSHGDIYYQVFQSSNQEGDKTFAAGPGMNSLQLDDVTKEKGKKWIQALNDTWNKSDGDEEKHVPVADIKEYFEEIILEKPSHVLCSLCHNREDADVKSGDETKGDNSNDNRGVNSDDICFCCRQHLRIGKTIADGATNDRVCSVSTQELVSLPLVSSLPSDILSQMITRLWNEEDVDDLLPQRDVEVDKKLEKRKEKKKLEKNEITDVLLQGLPQEIIELMEKSNTCYGNEINTNKTSDMDFDESNISQTSDHIDNIIADVARCQSVDETDHTRNSSDLNTSGTSVIKEAIKDLTPKRQTDSFTVTREDVLSNLRSQRQRHSSISSVSTNKSSCSGISTLSGFLPGFMRTPERKFRSSIKKRAVSEDKSDITDIDLMDEQFLSQESRKSVQMFTNISPSFQDNQNSQRKRNKVDSPRKRNKIDSDSESSQSLFRTPNILSPKKTKIKKNFVPGF